MEGMIDANESLGRLIPTDTRSPIPLGDLIDDSEHAVGRTGFMIARCPLTLIAEIVDPTLRFVTLQAPLAPWLHSPCAPEWNSPR